MAEAKKVTLMWYAKVMYRKTFETEEQWASFVRQVDDELDPTNLDAVYEYLNTGQGLSEEYITDLQSPHTWYDQVEYEIDDLVRDGEFVTEAVAET